MISKNKISKASQPLHDKPITEANFLLNMPLFLRFETNIYIKLSKFDNLAYRLRRFLKKEPLTFKQF